jgi:hypothetical protein
MAVAGNFRRSSRAGLGGNPISVGKIAVAAAVTAVIWAGCCTALAYKCGFPEPAVHDEFSYLLGADTFAHGRLANPPHPLGRFFESPQMLFLPKYAPKYPPGQALVLALGEKLLGAPYSGVLISGALMMFLLTMTLVAWTSPGPGIAVSVVLGLLFLPPMYWVYSYWGGCLAAAGGSAVLLAVALFRRDRPVAAGIVFGIGALTLFLTRPYEGGVLTAVATTIFGFRLGLTGMRMFFLSAVPMLAIGLLWAGWYNAAITGNPFRLPYLLHDSQYNVTPVFWFRPLRPEPVYSHARLAALYGRNSLDIPEYLRARSEWWHWPLRLALRSVDGIFGWGLTLLLLVPFAWRDWRIGTLAAVLGFCLLALSLETYHHPHYAAPLTIVIALLPACAAEKSWRLRNGSFRWGAILTCLVFAVACAFPLISAIRTARNGVNFDGTPGFARAALIRRLSAMDGEHLVIVRYPYPAWQVATEWVYNGADIDSQPVIFAHDLGMKENEALLSYYPSRRKWLITFSGDLAQLTAY